MAPKFTANSGFGCQSVPESRGLTPTQYLQIYFHEELWLSRLSIFVLADCSLIPAGRKCFISLSIFFNANRIVNGEKCHQSVCIVPKGKETSCHTGSSICRENMICGGLARTLAHMPITQEHHLLFCLLGGSLLAPRYFTVTQLAQA